MFLQDNIKNPFIGKQTERRLFESRYIDIELSNTAISYLVSNIENRLYSIYVLNTDLFSFSRTNIGTTVNSIKHNIIYLVDDVKKEEIKRALIDKFTVDNREYFYSEYQRINSNLSLINDDYIQLAYYNDQQVNRKITYSARNITDINSASNPLIESKICDSRYDYIFDYMNSVYNYRLKKEDMNISLDEMILLADQFILEYKKSNSKQKKIVKVKLDFI